MELRSELVSELDSSGCPYSSYTADCVTYRAAASHVADFVVEEVLLFGFAK